MQNDSALVWFRRDLRLFDNTALRQALEGYGRVYCVFVFDTTLLAQLPRRDRRIEFIRHALNELDRTMREQGGALIVLHGDPVSEIPKLARKLGVAAVHANRDYEPAAVQRDARVAEALAGMDVGFRDFKDQVIFEKSEVMTQGGTPFSVFTPYKNAWLKRLLPGDLQVHEADFGRLARPDFPTAVPELAALGFEPTNLAELKFPLGASGAASLFDDFQDRIDSYKEARDFPAVKGVSYLSVHLRFGTLSIRQLAAFAYARGGRGAETWLSELIWREFYMMILWHHPRVVEHCFKPEYDALCWDEDEALFAAWCEGRTGYPIVDAAMRQIKQSGYMHNRLRMIVASFLTKDLGISWRRGEAYFAEHLNDFELASNNGGWQWAASTGCDAQPYFRIFNPVTQSEKFDPQGKFLRRYLPELNKVPDKFIHAPWTMKPSDAEACGFVLGHDYPAPVVNHAQARERTLARFAAVKQGASDHV
ncbi:MAG: deoxyribodipyrimidine photo-lyase [Rhodocyclaceae bacterium]|nr:deoxyribodipyrimidine photo-lyase [Rhodocyclaceae bacterium]